MRLPAAIGSAGDRVPATSAASADVLGRDGARRQVPVVVEHAHDREVGVSGASRDADDRGQRSAQIRRRGDLCRGVGEQFDGQPPGLDDHRKEKYRLHIPPWLSRCGTSPAPPEDDTPSLDPLAIEQAYRRERARRRARMERRSATRRSNVRFWVTCSSLVFLAAFVMLAAWHEVETLFGI